MSARPEWSVVDWLARFEAAGGFLGPGSLGWRIEDQLDDEQHAARLIYEEARHNPERMVAIKALARSPEHLKRYYASLREEGTC